MQTEGMRKAQNCKMIYYLITHSVTDQVNRKLGLKQNLYTIKLGEKDFQNGVLLLKVLIDTYYSSTRTTTMEIRGKLAQLTWYMDNIAKGDVRALCHYTRSQMAELEAAGETSSDLITNLFNALEKTPNNRFKNWLEGERAKYTMKETDFKEDGSDLMDKAEQFYMSVQSGNQQPQKYRPYFALQATTQDEDDKLNALDNLSQQMLAFAARISNKEQDQKWQWKDIPPKQGESTTKLKVIDGIERTYHWCPNHKKWTIHSATECKGTQQVRQMNIRRGRSNLRGKIENMQIAFQALTSAITNEDDDSNCSIQSSNSNTSFKSAGETENVHESAYYDDDDETEQS